jgi:photosystem II stability/assembly factor-like uncharacterized protein
MRNVLALFALLSLLILPVPGKISEQYGITLPIHNSSFHGSEFAWIITGKRDLISTINGGKSWNTVFAKTVGEFEHICFINAKTGWTINADGQVWKTNDSGITWTLLASLEDKSVEQIKFVDSLHGWIISPFLVWRTDDGGLNWQHNVLSLPNRAKQLTHFVYFTDSKTGWVGGENAAIYNTADGGRYWQDRSIPSSKANIFDVFFLDEKNGWVCGLPKGGIYQTKDGGKTWNQQKLPYQIADIFSVHFLDKNNGWAVGSYVKESSSGVEEEAGGLVLHTTDGGEHWQHIKVGRQDLWCSRVYFGDSSHGWIIGRNHVYRTNDGGKSWEIVFIAPEVKLEPSLKR